MDVKALRAKVEMTQKSSLRQIWFSYGHSCGIGSAGDRTPHGASLVLLNVIERNPKAVIEALID